SVRRVGRRRAWDHPPLSGARADPEGARALLGGAGDGASTAGASGCYLETGEESRRGPGLSFVSSRAGGAGDDEQIWIHRAGRPAEQVIKPRKRIDHELACGLGHAQIGHADDIDLNRDWNADRLLVCLFPLALEVSDRVGGRPAACSPPDRPWVLCLNRDQSQKSLRIMVSTDFRKRASVYLSRIALRLDPLYSPLC